MTPEILSSFVVYREKLTSRLFEEQVQTYKNIISRVEAHLQIPLLILA